MKRVKKVVPPRNIPCPRKGCANFFRNIAGMRSHMTSMHRTDTPPPSSPDLSSSPEPQMDMQEDHNGDFIIPDEHPVNNDEDVPRPETPLNVPKAKTRVEHHPILTGMLNPNYFLLRWLTSQ